MHRTTLALMLAVAVTAGGPMSAQKDWIGWGQDSGGTKFSDLTQINVENVKGLKRAWVFHTGDSTGFFESTPLVIDSVMYFSTTQGIFALDAVSGQQIWKYETTGTARRGPTYWPGGNGLAPRIFSSAADGLVALDAKTGTVVTSFGQKGVIPGLRVSSPPSIYRNVLITQGGNSTVKAWDTVTGEPRWTLQLKAQPDDPNIATWLATARRHRKVPGSGASFPWISSAASCSFPSKKSATTISAARTTATTSTAIHSSPSMPSPARSSGISSWSTTTSGTTTSPPSRRWSRCGATAGSFPGVAQITKMGLLFVFNRETGEPMYGWEERPVPQTTLRGEWTSPTQPFPLKPPPLARNSLKREELAKVTPELEAYCKALWEKYNLSDTVPYNPWQEKQDIVVYPGAIGGGNWQGVMFNRPLGPHDHQRHERRAVGTHGGARAWCGARRRATRWAARQRDRRRLQARPEAPRRGRSRRRRRGRGRGRRSR